MLEKAGGSWRKPASQIPVRYRYEYHFLVPKGSLGFHTTDHPQKPHSTGCKTSRTRSIFLYGSPSGAAPKRSAQRNNGIYHRKYECKYPSLTRNKSSWFQTETYCTNFLCPLADYRYIYFIAIHRKHILPNTYTPI